MPVFRVTPSERTLIIPEQVNAPETVTAPAAAESTGESEALPDFLAGDEDEAPADADEEPAHMVAAE